MSITTVFFYEELKTLIGTSQSQKWLSKEMERLNFPRNTCHPFKCSRNITLRALEQTRHHYSTTLKDLRHSVSNGLGCKPNKIENSSDISLDSRTEKWIGCADDMWLMFTDSAYLAEAYGPHESFALHFNTR